MRLCPMDRWVREVQYRQFRRLDWSKVDDAVIECVIERCAHVCLPRRASDVNKVFTSLKCQPKYRIRVGCRRPPRLPASVGRVECALPSGIADGRPQRHTGFDEVQRPVHQFY
jgi:hypothetical protein